MYGLVSVFIIEHSPLGLFYMSYFPFYQYYLSFLVYFGPMLQFNFTTLTVPPLVSDFIVYPSFYLGTAKNLCGRSSHNNSVHWYLMRITERQERLLCVTGRMNQLMLKARYPIMPLYPPAKFVLLHRFRKQAGSFKTASETCYCQSRCMEEKTPLNDLVFNLTVDFTVIWKWKPKLKCELTLRAGTVSVFLKQAVRSQ